MANAEPKGSKVASTKNNDYPAEIFYSCYSPRILKHLIQNGFSPKATFVNIKTLKTCHVFERNDALNECITEVSNVN